MELSDKETDILMKQCLNIGEAMYQAGGEIRRIEDTLRRIGKAYGAIHMNVYAITSSILVTMEFENRPTVTQSRRIIRPDSMDFHRLEQLNRLSRRISAEPLPVEALRSEVLAILNEKPKSGPVLLGMVLAAGFFAVFFGGTLWEALIAGLVSAAIWVLNRALHPLCSGRVFFHFVTALLSGLMVCLACRLLPFLQFSVIMIADIMVLIPGIAITNSLRYTISGDTISGFEKLIDSVLVACAIAAGISLAIFLLGRV